jgi:hypothetical protein
MSLFLKYFICIDAIALDYRANLPSCLVPAALAEQPKSAGLHHASDGKGRIACNYRTDSEKAFHLGSFPRFISSSS